MPTVEHAPDTSTSQSFQIHSVNLPAYQSHLCIEGSVAYMAVAPSIDSERRMYEDQKTKLPVDRMTSQIIRDDVTDCLG